MLTILILPNQEHNISLSIYLCHQIFWFNLCGILWAAGFLKLPRFNNPLRMEFKRQACIWDKLMSFRRRQGHPTPVFLPGKSHGWRSLVGCSPMSFRCFGFRYLDRAYFQISMPQWVHFSVSDFRMAFKVAFTTGYIYRILWGVS